MSTVSRTLIFLGILAAAFWESSSEPWSAGAAGSAVISQTVRTLDGHSAWIEPNDLRPNGTETIVPVVLHMMSDVRCVKFDSCRRECPTNTPTCLWTPATVKLHFARTGLVNKIWKVAGIRLAVVEVREHPYDPRKFRQEDDELAPGLPPQDHDPAVWEASQEAWRYQEVDRRFSAHGLLNMFVWLQTSEHDIIYFGTSPRHPRMRGRPAIVWADAFCATGKLTPGSCARKLAHEIGHALTLLHSTKPGAQGDAAREQFPACRGRRTTDPAALDKNLMRPSTRTLGEHIEGYTRLTDWQKCQAKSAAEAFFRPGGSPAR